jgi:hypothetical protein
MKQNDIETLMECLRADFKILARKTELWTTEVYEIYLRGIEKLLGQDYINTIEVVLRNNVNVVTRANKYSVQTQYKNLQNDRPGNIDWDSTDGTNLSVLLNMSDKFMSLSPLERTNILSSIEGNWGATLDYVPYSNMQRNSGKTFSGEGSHINRIDYTNGI